MLPVAEAIADECEQCSDHLTEEAGKINKHIKR